MNDTSSDRTDEATDTKDAHENEPHKAEPVMKDPTDTDHPAGAAQAAENAATESPS